MSWYAKEDDLHQVFLQAVIDRKPARIPLGFCLRKEDFDPRRQCVKSKHPNAKDYDEEMQKAIMKANTIASRYRREDKLLNPDDFRREYNKPTEKMDLIKFIKSELELRKPEFSLSTAKQHQTLVNKLQKFKSAVPFNQVNREFIQKFRNELISLKNGGATIEKLIKILKYYLTRARKSGISIPEIEIKIRTFRSNRNALTEQEVKHLDHYYRQSDTADSHKRVLQYFLFSCYTGLRISDIMTITWMNVQGDLLIFQPVRTKKKNELVTVPLVKANRQYLPTYSSDNAKVFLTFTEQANNRILKAIANKLGIKKTVTFHTSRHTFGSMIAESRDVIALQRLMGHGNVKTSMEYVHTNLKQLVEAMKSRFESTRSFE